MLQNEQQLEAIAALITSLGLTGTDEEVMASLNAKSVMRYSSLSSSELNRWAATNPGTRKIIYVAASDPDHADFDTCAAALFAMQNTTESLNMADPVNRALVAQLPIAEAAKANLLTLAEAPVSPATEAGLPEILLGYVQEARKL